MLEPTHPRTATRSLLTLLASALVTAAAADGSAPKEHPELKPVAIVYPIGNDQATIYVLNDPYVAEVAGKTVIAGIGSLWHKEAWDHGLTIWIDWAQVQSLIQLDSIEQAQQRLEAEE